MNPLVAQRFWCKVAIGNMVPTDCWLWTGARNQNGYGVFRAGRSLRTAHRVAYELLVGPIPDGLVLDHVVCQVKPCVNPLHLDPVTQAENVRRYAALRRAAA